MKYYIYISDAKVDMLLPQISNDDKKKISTELKFDLKILSAVRKSETDYADDRIKRLEAVSTFILDFGNVGTINDPDEYIFDVVPLKMSVIDKSDLVCFGGESSQAVTLLGGSARHLLGNEPQTKTYAWGSHLIPMLQRIEQLSKTDEEFTDFDARFVHRLVIEALRSLHGPEQRLEFLAKRLYYESSDDMSILIASPIFVALVD